MLARQRVVRSELGEDGDHHAAQQVLAPGVLFGAEDTLQLLQRLFGVTAVPG